MASFFIRLRGLPIQLLTWIVLPTLLALVLVAYQGVTLHERDMQNLVSDRDLRAVQAAASGLADRVAQRRLVLQGIANQLGDGLSLQRLLDEQPELRSVFDGGLIVTDVSGTITDSWQPVTRWDSTLRSTAAPWVVENATGTPLVIAMAHSVDGKLTVFGGISLTSLNVPATLGVMRGDSPTQFYLIGDDGQVLDSSTKTLIGTAHKDLTATNQDMITATSQVEGLNWTLVLQEPWQDVITPELRASLVAPLATAPAILLAAAILLFGVWRVVLPLRRLDLATQRLTWGDYQAIQPSVGGVQEIQDLQTALRRMALRLQQTQAGMHSYIGAVMQGQEDERKRLSRELHDDTLQALIALDQQRQMAQRTLDRDVSKVPERLDQLHQMIDETIQGLRKLIRDMRPSYLEDLGLTPALDMLCTQTTTPEVAVTFSGDPTPPRLSANQELSLYRVAQEAVSNALHHAHATRIELTLHFDSSVTLCIQDNGKGFTIPERPDVFVQTGHYGLMGMVERAEQIGAQFRIDSETSGTRIEVRLPITAVLK